MLQLEERNATLFSLAVENVGKQIGTVDILSDVSFTAENGECIAILGENGSGKTTLLQTIAGLIHPTSGHALINGADPAKDPENALSNVCGFTGIPAFYPQLSATENLRLLCPDKVPGRDEPDRILECLHTMGLEREGDKRTGDYSRGMLQRLGFALTLLRDRQLMILDEPTQGVDPKWEEVLAKTINAKTATGKTVLLTSHNFAFILKTCHKALILERGKVMYWGDLREISTLPYYFELACAQPEAARAALDEMDYLHDIAERDGIFELILKREDGPRLVNTMVEKGIPVQEFRMKRFTIPDLLYIFSTYKK